MEKPIKKQPRYSDQIARISLVGLGLLLFLASALFAWQLRTIQQQPLSPVIDITPLTAKLVSQSQRLAALETQIDRLEHTTTAPPTDGNPHTLFCIQMAIITLHTQQATEQASIWLSRIETSDPDLQEQINLQKTALAQYHKPNIEPRLIKLQALIQQIQKLDSRPTLATATQYAAPEKVVSLPAFLDRYLIIRRQDNARAQYWFDATEQAITTQEIVGALYVAQLALVSSQEDDYQQALAQAIKALQRLHTSDTSIIAPIVTALQAPLPQVTLPDLYPLYEKAQHTKSPIEKTPIASHSTVEPSPHMPLVSEAF